MIQNRLLYLGSLLFALWGLVFRSEYVFFLLSIIIAALPFISLFIALPYYKKCAVKIRNNSSDGKRGPGDTKKVSLIIEPVSHVFPIHMNVRTENLFYGTAENHKVHLAYDYTRFTWTSTESPGCGKMRLSVTKLHMLDLLGLWKMPVPLPETVEFLVKPTPTAFSKWPLDELVCQNADYFDNNLARGDSGDREIKGIRSYLPGDPLRDVHWKLTARRDEPIVREYENQNTPLVLIAMIWAGPPWRLEPAIGRLLGIADYLDFYRQPFVLLLFEATCRGGTRLLSYTFENAKDCEEILWERLTVKPETTDETLEKLLKSEDIKEPNLLMVAPEAVTLYESCEEGLWKEA